MLLSQTATSRHLKSPILPVLVRSVGDNVGGIMLDEVFCKQAACLANSRCRKRHWAL